MKYLTLLVVLSTIIIASSYHTYLLYDYMEYIAKNPRCQAKISNYLHLKNITDDIKKKST
jgi:hypothetical protein